MEVNLKDLFFLLIRRSFILIIALIVGALAAFSYTKIAIDPTYDCEVTFVVNVDPSAQTTTGTINASQSLVNTYIAIMKDYSFAQMVKNELPESIKRYSISQIRKTMTLSSVDGSQILSVKIKTENPNHSYFIAKAIEENAPVTLRSYFDNSGSITVLRRAAVPKSASGPNIRVNVVVGALIGFAITLVIVIAIEMLDKRIKTEEDLLTFNYPVLGTIHKIDEV